VSWEGEKEEAYAHAHPNTRAGERCTIDLPTAAAIDKDTFMRTQTQTQTQAQTQAQPKTLAQTQTQTQTHSTLPDEPPSRELQSPMHRAVQDDLSVHCRICRARSWTRVLLYGTPGKLSALCLQKMTASM